jgi:NAD(P)-dependent dehydrogenase (short-subunit alcohol dehydrogenase family)
MNVLITGCSRGIGKAMLDNLIARPDVEKIYALSSNTKMTFFFKKSH